MQTVDHDGDREEDVSKIGMKFEFRGTQFCRNRRERAFERSRPKGKRPVAGHAQKADFINQRRLETSKMSCLMEFQYWYDRCRS